MNQRRLPQQSTKQGCRFLRLGVNENFPQFNTYIFEDSEKLSRVLRELSNKE